MSGLGARGGAERRGRGGATAPDFACGERRRAAVRRPVSPSANDPTTRSESRQGRQGGVIDTRALPTKPRPTTPAAQRRQPALPPDLATTTDPDPAGREQGKQSAARERVMPSSRTSPNDSPDCRASRRTRSGAAARICAFWPRRGTVWPEVAPHD